MEGDDNHGDRPETSTPPVPPQTQQIPHIVSSIKLPILKKGERSLARFHLIADAKEMWEAIKSRFGSNDKSKKMQKYLLKQQFESFSVSSSEGLHKGYDRWPSMRIKKFHKRTGRKLQFDTKDLVGFDKTKVECFNCHKIGHFAKDCRAKGNRRDAGYNGNKARDNSRRPTYQEESNALGTVDGEDIDWSVHVEEDAKNYAMMAYSSNTSGSDSEVQSCSQACVDSYARLKKLYNEQRDKLSDASVEITAYTLALKR
nr:ribonuclease H-like domain-containing protein [Tanacetum cinerariifolium]